MVTSKKPLMVIIFLWLIAAPVVFGDQSVPPSVLIGSDPLDSQMTIRLDPIDRQSLLNEDRMLNGPGMPFRIGIKRPVPTISKENGQTIMDPVYGLIWRIRMISPEARKLRVQLTDVNIPAGGTLYVYSTGAEMSETYSGTGPNRNGTIWAWSTDGPDVTIEWVQPEIQTGSIPDLPFTISGIAHAYIDPNRDRDREGDCHNDATCDESYRPQRDASAYIEFIDSSEWYICSGTMVNNLNQDFRPFFVTANHCISTDEVAGTVQVYFFYHTQVCNAGNAPRGSRKLGSDLRITTGDSDFTLLELTDTGFDGIYYAGWDRNPLATNEAITSIHHPDGAYKRISYGSRTTQTDPDYWIVRWNRTDNPGVTEGGSSRCSLYRDSNHLLVGQLTGGLSSCNFQLGADEYGRLDVSFSDTAVEQYLGDAMTCPGAYFGGAVPTPTWAPTGTAVPPTGTTYPTGTPTRTHTPGPTHTPTVMISITPSPSPTIIHTPTPTPPHTPTLTPTPSHTPVVSPTNTPISDCTRLGCKVYMPQTDYATGDTFFCDVIICEPEPDADYQIPLFVVLDVWGALYFAPSFTSYDVYFIRVTSGISRVSVIPPFQWPEGTGTMNDLYWYAGMTNPEMTALWGDYDAVSFGWHE